MATHSDGINPINTGYTHTSTTAMTHAMTTEITHQSPNTTLTPDEPESSTNDSASLPESADAKLPPASSSSSGSNVTADDHGSTHTRTSGDLTQSQNGESDAARAALIRLLHTIADIVQSIGDPIPPDQIPTVSIDDIDGWRTAPAPVDSTVSAHALLMQARQRLMGLHRSFLTGDLPLCLGVALTALIVCGQLSIYLSSWNRLKEPCLLSRALVDYLNDDFSFQLLKATRHPFMTQLLRQLVAMHDETHEDGTLNEIRSLFDALCSDEVTQRLLDNFDPTESLPSIRTLAVASHCLGDDARTAEVYRRYRALLAHRPASLSEQLDMHVNREIASLAIMFGSFIIRRATQDQLTDLTEADNGILDAELKLLDELSHAPLPAVILNHILLLKVEAHLARNEVRAAWSKVDDLKRLTRQAVSRSISIHIPIVTVCSRVMTNLDGDFTDADRLAAASDALVPLSRLIHAVQTRRSDPDSLNELIALHEACIEFRQTLEKKLAGGDTIAQDEATEETFLEERCWAGISTSSLTTIRDVTDEHRRSVLELISAGDFDGAIRATQRLYGIGNPAVPPKYDFSLDRAGGRTGVCLFGATKPDRTPRIGSAAFESGSHGLGDMILAITIAHEDMHRRQYRHLPHVDTRRLKSGRTDGQLTDEEYNRIVAIQVRETHLFESMCYQAETSDIDEIIKQAESAETWNLTDRQRERLRSMRDESAATAQSELAKAELDPALGITEPSQLCDLSTLRSALSSVLRDLPPAYLDRGIAASMTSSFHTGGATFLSAASVLTRLSSSIGVDEDVLNQRLEQFHVPADCDAHQVDEPDWGDDSELNDTDPYESSVSGGVAPINTSAGVELTSAKPLEESDSRARAD